MKTDLAKMVLEHTATGRPAMRSPASMSPALRARQSQKIQEIRQALMDSGLVTFDDQAAALGLPRSTTWAVLQGNHKCSGLRASLVARMMASPKLPHAARMTLAAYIDEKIRGDYGHNKLQQTRFNAQLQRYININAASQ